MEFNELTLSEQIKVVAIKLDETEFNDWLHEQVVGLAEYMQSQGIPQPYETAKRYIFDKVSEAALAN